MMNAKHLVFLFGILAGGDAVAAGLMLAPRAVRPLARGGAFVAGADDLNALSYNPAGLAEADNSLLFDSGLPIHSTTFTRTVRGVEQDAVQGSGFGIPSPTMGLVHDLGLVEGLRFGVDLAFDYPGLQNWPTELDDGSAAPQRYAVESFEGSGFGKLGLGAGYRVTDWLSVGAAFHLLAGRFAAQMTVSACDGVICTQPENTDYDARMRMVIPAFAIPGAHVGAILKPTPWLRVGLAWETAYNMNSNANLTMRMPAAPMFASASVFPSEPTARVRMTIPMQARGGVEVRGDDWRVEAAVVWEQWSKHEAILLQPDHVGMEDVLMLGRYEMADMQIDRRFVDTWSARLGGEFSPTIGDIRALTVRAGVSWEPSAIPDETLTPMTVDLDTITFGGGVAYAFGSFQLEAAYAYLWMPTRTVLASEAVQMNPTRPPWDGLTAVGNGTYSSSAHIIGVGVTYRLE